MKSKVILTHGSAFDIIRTGKRFLRKDNDVNN